jgi:hypothetical protein
MGTSKRSSCADKRAQASQGLLPFGFEVAARPMDLTAQAGLTLVAETLMALGTEALVSSELRVRRRQRGHTEFDKLQAIVLLLAAGGDCVEDVRKLREDVALSKLLLRPAPSPDALHEFLGLFHDESQESCREKGAFIPSENAALRGLCRVHSELVRRAVMAHNPTTATLDLDATVIESHKRAALPHYKGGRGYQPTAVLWASQAFRADGFSAPRKEWAGPNRAGGGSRPQSQSSRVGGRTSDLPTRRRHCAVRSAHVVR